MHFLKAAGITAVFFIGFVFGKDLYLAIMNKATATGAGTSAAA